MMSVWQKFVPSGNFQNTDSVCNPEMKAEPRIHRAEYKKLQKSRVLVMHTPFGIDYLLHVFNIVFTFFTLYSKQPQYLLYPLPSNLYYS
jgi:hypothetical protein